MTVLSDPVFSLFFGLGLLAASASDLRYRKVPNALNASIAVVGMCYQVTRYGWIGTADALLGIATGFACVLVPFAMRLHRGGDAKLVMALGAWLAPRLILWAYIWGVALGGIVAIGVFLTVGREARRRIAKNLKLSAGTATLPVVEEDRPAHQQVPMALAFSAGALVALMLE